MNSLSAAAALVPYRAKEEPMQSLIDSVTSMSLSDLLATLVLPRDEEEYTFNLSGVVKRFNKKDVPPRKEITEGVVETFREMQELEEGLDDHHNEGLHLIKRIAKWGLGRIVKWVFKFAFKMMYRFARWVFKEILINGIKALVEWVVRPVITEILGFVGLNPELWPFIAIAGGTIALGYTAWRMFFDKPKDNKLSQAADLAQRKQREEADDAEDDRRDSDQYLASSLAQSQAYVGAAAPEAAGAPVAAGPASSLAALISRGEGGYNSVNLGAAHGYRSSVVDLTNMTLSEVMAHQKAHDFNAAGRYQIIGSTLETAVSALHLSGGEKFDAALQDRIFSQYLIGIKQPAISNYLSGKSNDLAAAVLAASQEWASVAAPAGARTQNGMLSDGTISYYSGVANNRASISADEMARTLMAARGQALDNTQVVSASSVTQTPGVKVDTTHESSPTSLPQPDSAAGSKHHSSKSDKTYIKGPKGSIVAVS